MDYIKRDKKRKLKENLIKLLIFLLVFLILILSYIVYQNTNLEQTNLSEKNVTIEKTYQTIDNIKKNNETVTDMLSNLSSSVVGISKIENTGNSIFSWDNINNLGLGTGVIVAENGYILTNAHVSGEKYSKCYVTLIDGKTYNGQVVWSNIDIDMAIVKINQKGLTAAKLGDSDKIEVGETVYAIGNPIGYEFQRSVTSGIISALNRTIKFEENNEEIYMEDLIQTDATINPGNSGGPLINIDGEVIGINGVKITSAEGISFAIPINTVKSVIDSFKNNGRFEEASLGIFAFDKNVLGYIDENLRFSEGIYVEKVNKNSAAEEAGLRKGDIILSIDGKNLERMCDLRCYIYTKKPGDKVKLKIQRNYREIEVAATLKKKI
jgi:serine protease Do